MANLTLTVDAKSVAEAERLDVDSEALSNAAEQKLVELLDLLGAEHNV